MLKYVSINGDENYAVYNYKKVNPTIKNLAEELILRE